MLTSIRLKNFKSFADQTVRLSPLTLLVGANASGKSNLLDALRFLQGVGLDLPLSDIFRGRADGEREVWPGLRGGAQGAVRAGERSFTIESRWTLGKDELLHKITCSIDPEPTVEHESLEAAAGRLFDTQTSTLKGLEGYASGGAMKATPKSRRSLRAASTDKHPARRSLLGQIEHQRGRADDVRLADAVALCDAVQGAMRRTLSLDIDPSRMRGYVPADLDHLGPGGQNLSAVARRLCLDADSKADFVGWLSALCAPEIADVDFVKTDLGDVMMVVVEKDGTRVPAPCLPGGALRVLGEVLAALTAPEGSRLLLEELGSGLHPAQAGLLVRILEEATRPGQCQILATTHSPALLEAMSREPLGDAVILGREPGAEGTVARRLADLPRLDEIVAGGAGRLLAEKSPAL